MKLLIVTVILISAGLFAIYFALFVKAKVTVLMDAMNIQRLDFASGLSQQDILIKYLESFVELSTKPPQPVDDDVDFAIKVGKHALKPLQVEMLHTGSLAEGVSAPYMKPTVIGLPVTYSPECDIMAVVKLKDVLQNSLNYQLKVLEDQPCFVSLALSGNIDDTPQLKTVYKDNSRVNTAFEYIYSDNPFKLLGNSLLEVRNGQAVISPILFLEYCKQVFTTTVDFSRITFNEPMSFHLKTRYHSVSLHGPAVKLQSDTYLKMGMVIYPKVEGPGLDEPMYSAEEERTNNQNDLDIVPAIHLPEWPMHASEWISRERVWPSKKFVDCMVSEGVMVVCKTPPGGDPDLHWRLSFSRAEVALLSTPELPCRQHAHKIFKYIIKHVISPPKVLNSYHCKTVMLWASERLPPDSWGWDRLGHIVLGLLDDMIAAICSKSLPHYFLPQVNLFENIPEDFLQTAGNKLVACRRNPIDNLPEFSTYNRDALLSRKKSNNNLETDQSEAIVSLLEAMKGPYTKEPEMHLPWVDEQNDQNVRERFENDMGTGTEDTAANSPHNQKSKL